MKILCNRTTGAIVEIFKDANGDLDNTIELNGINPDFCFVEAEDNADATSLDDCIVVKSKYNKLEIVRALDSLDELDELLTFLNDPDNARFKLLWDVAPVIDLADPDTQAALTSINIDVEAVKRKMA